MTSGPQEKVPTGGELTLFEAVDPSGLNSFCCVARRRLGHTNLGITSIYLQGIDNAEIIDTVHARRAPMVPVHNSLRI